MKNHLTNQQNWFFFSYFILNFLNICHKYFCRKVSLGSCLDYPVWEERGILLRYCRPKKALWVEIPTRIFASILTRMPIPSCLRGILSFSSIIKVLNLPLFCSLAHGILILFFKSRASLPSSLPMPQLLPSLIYIHYLISLMTCAMFMYHLIFSDCIIATDNNLWWILCEPSPAEHIYASCWFLG